MLDLLKKVALAALFVVITVVCCLVVMFIVVVIFNMANSAVANANHSQAFQEMLSTGLFN